MIDYKDPVPPIIQLLNATFESRFNIYGNLFPSSVSLPAVLVRQAGGNGYYRIQLLVRAREDITAMAILIDVMNYLERTGQFMSGIRVKWVERESNPIPAIDEDSGLPEAWCYMRIEALESGEET
ncbi:hypothetical protein COJ96_10920 [Bacillus sp. AFS073361]|uniref:hypothetical protein n=1 Tax=Bacillus sp. AFS073361 TaxID=2033511 RepID=UPI000BF6E85A|nr:hypothetical protein [Bacillus sp. AFS073361]PFP29408.1 hypothetical protein COJ96_10920 [Bacillus sp. AFS073361]